VVRSLIASGHKNCILRSIPKSSLLVSIVDVIQLRNREGEPGYENRFRNCELAGDQENAIADYQKALSKKNPALTPKRKAHAQARIRELSNHS
jgi:hypothetical protein